MPGFSRRPLAAFVCCLFSLAQIGPALADLEGQLPASGEAELSQPVDGAIPAVDPASLRLRKERQWGVATRKAKKAPPLPPELGLDEPVVVEKDEPLPLFIMADHIEGTADELAEAQGNVELRKAGALIFADRLTYRPLDDEAEATGSVRMEQDGAEISAPHLKIKIDEQVGFAENATYHIVRDVQNEFYNPKGIKVRADKGNLTSGAPVMLNVPNSYGLPTEAPETRVTEANGQAERIDFEGENQIKLTAATYSTCKPGRPDWYLESGETHLDYDRNEGTARNAALWFGKVPLMYSPIISFPLNNQRRSGVLHPFFSTSTRTGLDFSVPYYWNIAPNYDLTLFPRYMSKRGFQLGAEARYLDHNYSGMTRLEYLPNDETRGRDRYGYRIDHRHDLGRGVSASINWNGVSDDYYWQDLSSRLLQTSQTQLTRQVQVGYTPSPWLRTSLQVLRYQTLQVDPATPVTRPYFLEPQLNLIGNKPDFFKADLTMVGQYSRFTHVDTSKDQGDRFIFYPQLSLPIVHPAFQFTPKVGVRMAKYSLDRRDPLNPNQPDSISYALPTFTVDSTVILEREGDWFGQGYIQTLEPRLYYVNIPYKDQSKIPLFDTALSDFNFAQIFSENRYSGYDRVNDANQLTAALTTRLLDGETGTERFKAMVGQRYYFKPQRVAITGETTRQANFSNLVAAFSGLVAPKTYVDTAWEYNYKERFSERLSAGVRFQPDFGKVLSASYRYTRDSLTGDPTVDQLDFAGQWPIAANWYAVGRYNYSLKDSKALEVIAGLEYNADCWALRVVGQRLAAVSGTPNETLFIQLELNDFGSVGSNPIQTLRRSIPGYGKTNELSDSGSLLTTQ